MWSWNGYTFVSGFYLSIRFPDGTARWHLICLFSEQFFKQISLLVKICQLFHSSHTFLSSSKKNKSVQLFKVHFFSSLWMMLEKGKLDSEIPGRVNQLKLRKNSLPFCLLSFFSLSLVNKKFRWETLSRKRRSFQEGDEKKKLDWDFYRVGCFVSRVTKCWCWRGSQGDGGPFKKKIII